MPSELHGITQMFLGGELLQLYPDFVTYSELTLRIDDQGDVTPDLCVYGPRDFDYENDQTRVEEPPVIAVEIASPTQSISELVSKGRRLIRAGTQSVWVVQPPIRTISVLASDRDVKTYEHGETLHDPSTGIEVDLDRVFRKPPSNSD